MAILPAPLSWFRKTLSILKSNLSPNQIAFGVALGVLAGLPPLGVHVIIPATLALFFRTSFRSFLLAAALSRLLSLALAPLAFAVGRWVLESQRGLDGLWRRLFHLPVLAPMGYSRYLLFGSLLLGLLLAVLAFFAVRSLVTQYRTGRFRPRVLDAVSRRWRRLPGSATVSRFLFAGGAKYETSKPRRGLFRFVRPGMLIGLPAIYALCYLAAAVIVPFFTTTLTTTTASWIAGTEVRAESSSFSLFSGALTVNDFSIQDPKAPEEDLLVIPRLELDAGMIPLLSKRVVFDSIRISDAALHVTREGDGTLNIDNPTSGWNSEDYLQWAAEHASQVDWLGLLRRFAKALSEPRPLPPRGDPYAPYRGGRSFAAFRAPFEVHQIEIGRLLVSLEDHYTPDTGPLPPVTLLEIELQNLAWPSTLRNGPMSVQLHGQFGDDPDSGFSLRAAFLTEEGEAAQMFDISLDRVDLVPLAALYATTLPVEILSGRVTLHAEADFENQTASGTASILLEDLELRRRAGRSLFGLSEDLSDRIVEGLNRYAKETPLLLAVPISGTADEPAIEWEAPLLDLAKQGLVMLGRSELNGAIGALSTQLETLGGLPAVPLDSGVRELYEQVSPLPLDLGSPPSSVPEVQSESSTGSGQDTLRGLFDRLFQTDGTGDP